MDRNIASLLSRIGELTILNIILSQDFSHLFELGYSLLRVGLKPPGDRGKSEKEFVNQNLRLENNRNNPAWVAEQIFKLYSLVEEKCKRGKDYEHIHIY
jgi:CRISPR-associated protein Cst1